MKKKHVGSLFLILLLILLISVPAMAEEGGDGLYSDVQPSGDEPSGEDPPSAMDPPSSEPGPEPGGEEPTPEPGGEDPTPEPGGEDPTPDPGWEEPTPEPDWEEPTPEPDWEEPTPEPDWEDPTPEPNWEAPTPEPSWESSEPSHSASPAATRAPGSGTGGTIRQPAALNPRDATPSPSPSGSPDPQADGPNYMTFAKLNQKNNSMSIVLFYGGASFVGVGSLGLIVLVVFIIRGRHSVDERDGIFEEIQQAESRYQPPAARPQRVHHAQELDQGYQERPPVVHRPEPEVLSVPVNGNMYTEEFDLPVRQPDPPAPGRVQPPPQATMYTEEFAIPEELPPAPPPPQRPQPVPPPAQPRSEVQYDTAELLREILQNGDEGQNRR